MKKQLSTLGKAVEAERKAYFDWLKSGAKERKGELPQGSEQKAFDAWQAACKLADELKEANDIETLTRAEGFYLTNDQFSLDQENDLPW